MADKILITGASGFIGGFLVEYALNQGYETYAGIRKSSSKEYLQDPRIQFCYLDFENKEQLGDILEKNKFNYIIHNAGVTKAKEESTYFKVNETYLINFISVIKDRKIALKKFISISSLAAYGPAEYTPDGIVKEDTIPHPVTAYGRSKLAGEKHLKSTTDIPYNIIRPTAVYGPREKDFSTVYQIVNKGMELLIGFKKQQLTFIYVDDLVRAIFTVMKQAKTGKNYFIADGDHYSGEAFHGVIKDCLKKKTLKIKLPIFAVSILAQISETISMVTGKYPALNKEKVNELKCQSWSCDVAPLKEDFNFVPQFDLNRGMETTILWNKKAGLL